MTRPLLLLTTLPWLLFAGCTKKSITNITEVGCDSTLARVYVQGDTTFTHISCYVSD